MRFIQIIVYRQIIRFK